MPTVATDPYPEVQEPPRDHRWSGWPGAWCLDCGAEDKRELCIVDHPEAFSGEETEENPFGMVEHCVNPPCPEHGSNRFNPYTQSRVGDATGDAGAPDS